MSDYLCAQIQLIRALVQDRRAVTAMEYGLIAALIAVVVIGSLTSVGGKLTAKFTAIAAALT